MKKFYLLMLISLSGMAFSQTIGLTTFATGFSSPIEITHPVGDPRLFVVQKGGSIKILNLDGTVNLTNFLTLPSGTVSNGSEQGLLGLAFHPNYATNGYFFLNYTNSAGNTVIARYSVSADPNIADPNSGTILLTINQPYSNHNGGTIRFGADGYLYIGMGDGGSGGDPGNRAQNISENLGKMLRIDVDGPAPYGIPPTNPYVGVAGNDEIWAIGLRNPWKFSFDMLNNDLWIADVGQDAYEEVNYNPAPVAPGLNFGWKCYEANNVYTNGCAVSGTNYTFPVAQYSHSIGCSITGGYVYRGTTYPNFYGKYFMADYCFNKIGMISVGSSTITWSNTFSGNFTTFGQDLNGEMYIAGINNGTVYKLIDTSQLANSSFETQDFQIYPNPASTEVFVRSEKIKFPAVANIYDLTGKLLRSQKITQTGQSISTTELPAGVYLMNIQGSDQTLWQSKLTIR